MYRIYINPNVIRRHGRYHVTLITLCSVIYITVINGFNIVSVILIYCILAVSIVRFSLNFSRKNNVNIDIRYLTNSVKYISHFYCSSNMKYLEFYSKIDEQMYSV